MGKGHQVWEPTIHPVRRRLAGAAAVAVNVTDRRFMPYYAELPRDRHHLLDRFQRTWIPWLSPRPR